ncbi:unnamed protein product, partial [Brugia pahangi]|uniref:F-box domain-containing protein n=1 Tax=Brugia pahangi TaxID=6280 RepID=A0A0N4TBL1_BRUPA
MLPSRLFTSVFSKLNSSWYRVIDSTRYLTNSKEVDTAETIPSALDANDSSTVESDLSDAVMDTVSKERLALPYSQKALETLNFLLMLPSRLFTSVLSKLNTSWYRVIDSTRYLTSSKEVDTAETIPSALDANDSSTVESDLSDAVMDTVSKERLALPYSQKALETLKLDKYPYYVEREWWKDGNRMTFWSTWRMKRDVKRRHLLAELGPDRVRLKALKSNIILPELIRDECAKKLHNLPKGSCPNLVQHLCQFSGARRGKLNRFHLH